MMKQLTLSLATIVALGTLAVAGGDIAPVEPVIDTPTVAPVSADEGFYIGGAYGYGTMEVDNEDDNFNAFMVQTGYKMNPYVSFEGRYWFTSGDGWNGTGQDFSADTWGIYVKPSYPITDAFDLYALLGYASADPEINSQKPDYDTDGFSWGVGASYDITPHVGLFVDYTNLYDDTNNGESLKVDTWNFGVSYKF